MKDVKSKVIEICNKSKIASYSLSEKKNSERNKALKIIANDILKNKIKIFLDISCIDDLFSLKEIFEHEFSNGQSLELEFFKNSSYETFITNTNRIVQFGWVKEAVPVIQEKKSIISRLFNLLR